MKFALLGADPDALALALAVVRSHEHQLVWAHELGDSEAAVRAAAPGVQIAEHWEGLLDGSLADVVIVARAVDQETRGAQLRKLAQAAVPLIASHPVVDSMLVYYELDMIRRENHAVLLAFTPGRWHPAWQPLHELVQADDRGPLGPLEQVVIERAAAARDRWSVLRHFARDLELARPLCGDLTTVAAMASTGVRSTPEATNYGALSVQMSGPSGVLVRWSVGPVEQREAARHSFLFARGKAVLDAPVAGPWRLDIQRDGETASQAFDAVNAPVEVLALLPDALRGAAPAELDWLAASRTMELTDAVEHSLQRGRSIDLHYETPTEHATFKGLMSGVGCFLLLGGLVILVVATAAMHAGVPLAVYWPYLLLAVLGVFLVLQLLGFVFPHNDRRTKPPETSSGP